MLGGVTSSATASTVWSGCSQRRHAAGSCTYPGTLPRMTAWAGGTREERNETKGLVPARCAQGIDCRRSHSVRKPDQGGGAGGGSHHGRTDRGGEKRREGHLLHRHGPGVCAAVG